MSKGRNSPGKPENCSKCGGSGIVQVDNSTLQQCSRCDGTGLEPEGELTEGQRNALGAAGGAAVGFSLGGPAGAILGGLLGVALSQQDDDKEDTNLQL